jgi:hypothetical protein
MLVWPRVQLLSGADGLPEHPRQVLLLRANNLVLGATHPAQHCRRAKSGCGPWTREQGEIGPDLFRHACPMALEGLVSKHRDSFYRAGRFDRWVKVKNRQHPAFSWVMDQLWPASSGAVL